jgi:hypothetical protein
MALSSSGCKLCNIFSVPYRAHGRKEKLSDRLGWTVRPRIREVLSSNFGSDTEYFFVFYYWWGGTESLGI